MKARSYATMLLAVGSTFTATSAIFAQADALPAARGKLTIQQVSRPARDSRGTLVVSDPAVVPEGANEPIGSQINRDPRVVFAPRASTEKYVRCTEYVTDNCIQLWEPPGQIPVCPGDPECPDG